MRGVWGLFWGSRMRSRSMRKWLTWMRGTWGVFWRSAHVPTIPFTWLRRAKALGRTAHASYHHATRCPHINVYVLFPMLDSCTLIGRKGSREQIDDVPYANEPHPHKDNSPLSFSRSDWLGPSLAICTTQEISREPLTVPKSALMWCSRSPTLLDD